MRFFHRVAMNLRDLRPRLIKNRLDLCFLFRRQIQILCHPIERATAHAAVSSAMIVRRILRIVGQNGAAQRQDAEGSECNEF